MKLMRSEKVLLAGAILFFFSIFYYLIIFPMVAKFRTKQLTELRPKKFMRGVWEALPFALGYRVWIFNVTNSEEIAKGEKPKLQEVGPFYYDMWVERPNSVDYKEDDSVSYNPKVTYFFNAEKSNGLTGEEEVIVPNYFILGLVNSLKIEKPTAIPVVGKAVDTIFKKPSSIFIKEKVKTLLFDGYLVNCTAKDFAASAVCSEVRAKYEQMGLKLVEEDVYLLSLFGAKNGTTSKDVMRINRGNKKQSKLGQVISFNGNTNISTWDDPKCDSFNEATDGSVLHPFYKKSDFLRIYVSDLCRVYDFDYIGNSKYAGMKTFVYTTDLGSDIEKNPHEKCFCTDPNNCMKKGAYETFKCTNLPIIVTNPHFYLADPSYLTMVDGLEPVKEKHMLHLDVMPLAGAPMHAHSRAQVNMQLVKVEKFKLMKTMPEALFPLVWFEVELNLPKFLVKVVRNGNLLFMVGKIFFYFTMLSGVGMSMTGGIMHYRASRKSRNVDVTKLSQNVDGEKLPANNLDDKSLPLNAAKLQPAPVPPAIE